MITKLLQVTDAVIGAALPVTTRHILASLKAGQPVVHTGGGNYTPIANDLTGYWSYQRIRGEVSVVSTRLAGDPCEALHATVPMRIVALLDRDTCIEEATELAALLRSSTRTAQTGIGAFSVAFERLTWSFDQLAGQEFAPLPQIPTNRTLLVMDASIAVRAKASCMVDCEPVDVTCAIIAAATLEKIRECLGPRLDDLCDIPSIACPLEWTVRDQDGNVLASGTVNDPCATPTLDVQVDCDECEPCPIRVEVRNTDGDLVDSASIPDPCEQEGPVVLTAPDGRIFWDGVRFTLVASDGTIDIDCDTPIPAAYVLDGGSKTGTYKVDGAVNGKTRYRLDANHTLEYSGTRWECVHPGPDDQAALGDETFPWLADWSGTSITVTQATIGQYCDDCPPQEPCPVAISINDTEVLTVDDPCVEPTVNIEVVNEDDTQVGSLVGGQWVVPTAKSLCTLITEAETTEEITDCIRSAGKRTDVQCNLMGTAEVANAVTEFNCFPSDVRAAILASECTPCPDPPPANVLREYTADDTWNKPSSPDFKGIWLFLTGGGGAGGAGHVAATNAPGGSGGGGGALVRMWIPAADLLSAETITIGLGGAGVSSGAANAGGNSSFGSHALAKGGSGGITGTGATVTGGAGGSFLSCLPIGSGFSDNGGTGGLGGRTTASATVGQDGMAVFAGPGGGGGSGFSTGSGGSGSRGGGVYNNGTATLGGAGGGPGNNGTNGVNNVNLNPFNGLVASTIGVGTAGGGGGGLNTGSQIGGNGGNGGYAAGGGGAGAGVVASGTSGSGGNGFCIIYEVYG